MPSSSQVLDHQLIFHIMNGLRQSHHRQDKEEEIKNIEVVCEDKIGEDSRSRRTRQKIAITSIDAKFLTSS